MKDGGSDWWLLMLGNIIVFGTAWVEERFENTLDDAFGLRGEAGVGGGGAGTGIVLSDVDKGVL